MTSFTIMVSHASSGIALYSVSLQFIQNHERGLALHRWLHSGLKAKVR